MHAEYYEKTEKIEQNKQNWIYCLLYIMSIVRMHRSIQLDV